MFITQRELDRRIEKAVKEAHDKWEGERWRDNQLDGMRQQIENIIRERYEMFDKLNERLFSVEKKVGLVPNPPSKQRTFIPMPEAQMPEAQAPEGSTE